MDGDGWRGWRGWRGWKIFVVNFLLFFDLFFCFGGIVKLMEGLVKSIVKPRIAESTMTGESIGNVFHFLWSP